MVHYNSALAHHWDMYAVLDPPSLRKASISHGTERGLRRRVLRSSSSSPLIRPPVRPRFPQDIRRALLNVISNGFYAATKRRAETDGGDYEPTLTASTKNLCNRVEIRIRDNGTDITRRT
jgi:hypothetical protein